MNQCRTHAMQTVAKRVRKACLTQQIPKLLKIKGTRASAFRDPAVTNFCKKKGQHLGAQGVRAHTGQRGNNIVLYTALLKIPPSSQKDFVGEIVLDITLQPSQQLDMPPNVRSLPNQLQVPSTILVIERRLGLHVFCDSNFSELNTGALKSRTGAAEIARVFCFNQWRTRKS